MQFVRRPLQRQTDHACPMAQTLPVPLPLEYASSHDTHRLEQPITEQQPTIERRDYARALRHELPVYIADGFAADMPFLQHIMHTTIACWASLLRVRSLQHMPRGLGFHESLFILRLGIGIRHHCAAYL